MLKSKKAIRVLLVDDSALTRGIIRAILAAEPDMDVVGEAANGLEAVAMVASLNPDIVTMDLEMPVMGGLEAIGRIIAEHPVPVLVVTTLTGVRTAFAAISMGALDVIAKPTLTLEDREFFLHKIRYLAKVDIRAHLHVTGKLDNGSADRGDAPEKGTPKGGIVAIAASTGGPVAIHAILSQLPGSFPLPIVVTQHIAEGFAEGMATWFNGATSLDVVLATDGARPSPGHVYVNPAEFSMRIVDSGVIRLGNWDAGTLYHPCCDTLLSSVAATFGKDAIGLIMSGMGDDGVAGMQAIGLAGGTTLAQDAESSVVFGMNRLAVERGCIQKVLPLADIPAELMLRAGAHS